MQNAAGGPALRAHAAGCATVARAIRLSSTHGRGVVSGSDVGTRRSRRPAAKEGDIATMEGEGLT